MTASNNGRLTLVCWFVSGWALSLRFMLLGSKSHRSLGILMKFLLMHAHNQEQCESLSLIQSDTLDVSTLGDGTHILTSKLLGLVCLTPSLKCCPLLLCFKESWGMNVVKVGLVQVWLQFLLIPWNTRIWISKQHDNKKRGQATGQCGHSTNVVYMLALPTDLSWWFLLSQVDFGTPDSCPNPSACRLLLFRIMLSSP